MSRKRSRAWLPCLLTTLGALAFSGCGGNQGFDAADSGDSPRRFVKQFQRITGVGLKPVSGDIVGTRLEVPAKPNRFVRFGAYSLVWTRDESKLKLLVGRSEPDEDGIHWRRVGTSYSATKPFGDRLVLRWVGRRAKRTNAQWDRLERAVEAAFEGDLGALPEEERPCGSEGLDPLRGSTGACSLKGIPVTFVEADDALSGSVLEAEVLGFGYADKVRNPGFTPLRPKGRFLIVAYRVTNRSNDPISFLQPKLRLGASTVAESPDAAVLLPRSRALPLPPGATVEAQSAFDLDEAADPRKGAFVLPVEREGSRDPSNLLAEGWIRLAEATPRLPRPSDGRRPRDRS